MLDLLHDEPDLTWVMVDLDDAVVLVDPKKYVDQLRIVAVLETKQGGVDLQLPRGSCDSTILQVVDAQRVLFKADGIRGAERILRVVQSLLRGHPVADSVVDVLVERLLILDLSNPQKDRLLREGVKLTASPSFLIRVKDSGQLVFLVVHPCVVARAEESVGSLEIGMYVEVHRTPRLRSLDK